jgi:rubrerythrin
VIAYIDDVLIYTETEEEHDKLVKEVLKRLEENGLVIFPEKCIWASNKVEFLGYIVETEYVCCLCGLSYQGSWLHRGPAELLYLC